MIDKDGWLDSAIKYPSVRHYGLLPPRPLGVVWHWTGSPGGAEWLAKSIQLYNPDADQAKSWHLLLARDGRIFQSVPFLQGAWHVGRPGIIRGQPFKNINKAAIGIELENAGKLKWTSGSWRNETNDVIPSERTVGIPQGVYDGFTTAQEASAVNMVKELSSAYDLPREAFCYGHYQFNKDKQDPGPVWMDTVLQRVLDVAFGAAVTLKETTNEPA